MAEGVIADKRDYKYSTVVLQPTTGCNLNCGYCYLPDRADPKFCTTQVLESVARTLERRSSETMVLWHGGEPLSSGRGRFREMISVFEPLRLSSRISHSLQTNGTLIDEAWCDFLLDNEVKVGLSLDGDRSANQHRVDWHNTPAYDRIIRGAYLLREAGIIFTMICVVDSSAIDRPEAVFDALALIGPSSISFNVVEAEGLNRNAHVPDGGAVYEFWRRLWRHWNSCGKTPSIRQFRDVLIKLGRSLRAGDNIVYRANPDPYPTVAFNGDVVLLSPELHSASAVERRQFVVGNVVQTDLDEIVRQGRESWYVKDSIEGRRRCAEECALFEYCGGGQASNKWFENGSFRSTCTAYCNNSRYLPAKVILNEVLNVDAPALDERFQSRTVTAQPSLSKKDRYRATRDAVDFQSNVGQEVGRRDTKG